MRDYLVLAILIIGVPVSMVRPFIGVLLWSWVSYMNPHRLTWGIAYDFPAAMVIGGRNLGAAYFDTSPNEGFADLDLLVAGPVVREASASFDGYWNSAWAIRWYCRSSVCSAISASAARAAKASWPETSRRRFESRGIAPGPGASRCAIEVLAG